MLSMHAILFYPTIENLVDATNAIETQMRKKNRKIGKLTKTKQVDRLTENNAKDKE